MERKIEIYASGDGRYTLATFVADGPLWVMTSERLYVTYVGASNAGKCYLDSGELVL